MSHPIPQSVYRNKYYYHKKTLPKYTLDQILEEMCAIMKEDVEFVKGEVKCEKAVKIRRMFSYVTLIIDHHSTISVGKFLGYKDHTNIIYHRKKVRQFIDTDDYEFYKDWSKYTRKSKIWKEYNNK